ncbi:MAG: hypothetical protein ACLSA6_08745 [Holdemania massiliensis]
MPFTFSLSYDTSRRSDCSLRDRFGIVNKLEYYDEDQLSQIVSRTSRVLNVEAAPEAVREIAKRSRGTPRIANRLLQTGARFLQVLNHGVISLEVAQTALDRLRVDS